MPRLPRLDAPGVAQHIIQRGNNRQIMFACDEDMAAYANWLREYALEYSVDIHAWVFMANHVHLLLTAHGSMGASKLMQSLGRSYVQYFNFKYDRTGTLWEGRFRSCLVESTNYVLACYRYIELNPIRAGMAESPKDYHWSSFRANALGLPTKLCTPHPSYIGLGESPLQRQEKYRALFLNDLSEDTLSDIRETTQQGRVFGSSKFKEQMEELLGRRVEHRPLGRPKKGV